MKKTYLTFVLILISISLFAQNGNGVNSSVFKSGEWFQFRIHYGPFNASYATMQLNETNYKGKSVYHVIGKGTTTGLARLFFKGDDNYESYFDKVDGKPYRFIRQIDEGGYTKDLEILFNHEVNSAIAYDRKRKKDTTLTIPVGVQDMMSAFYYFRNNVEFNKLKYGDDFVIDMILDDDEIFKFKMRYLGKEVLRTKFGKVETLKFRPYVQSGRVFKAKESLTVWISNDENRAPVRIKASLRVGSIVADLEGFKGLKNSFKIIMN